MSYGLDVHLVSGYEESVMPRKRSDLEEKVDTLQSSWSNFMSNHWLHQVREVATLQGQMKILIGLVGGLFAFVVGVWLVEVMK